MKESLRTLGWFLAGLLGLSLAVVVPVERFHARRFRACAEELEAAVRAGKTFEAFTQDARRGWMKRYSIQERGELLAEIQNRSHTNKDAANVNAMSGRAHTSAIFAVRSMVYVLFFDREERLREFVCLSN